MKYKLVFILIYLGFIKCAPTKDAIEISDEFVLSTDQPSGSPYFTEDQHANPVLCWTAGEKDNGKLYYAVYDNQSKIFQTPIAVIPSIGTSMHSESMNKIAFKSDGTIIAVYGRKHPSEKNKYAGSVVYTQSFDQGKSWTEEQFVHTDTLRDNSRSFFDIAVLPDGEVGCVWLDGRFKSSEGGTALFFSKTNDKNGFIQDKQIGETVCECCRTDIYTDKRGKINILYRDIETSVKGQVRDLAYTFSSDSGKTFSSFKKISDDNWLIDGCPHTGASMTFSNDQLGIVWFTAGGKPGLYYTLTTDGQVFLPRQLISEEGRHPQISSDSDQIMIVWDEMQQPVKMVHNEQKQDHHHSSGGRVVVALLDQSGKVNQTVIDEDGEFPVLHKISNGEAIIAYTRNKQVVVRKIMP